GITVDPPPALERILLPEPVTPSRREIAGIPVPVPDATVPPDRTIAAQRDMVAVTPQTDAAGPGGITVPAPVEESLPAFRQWVPTDELPEPVKEITPVYSDIAREAGAEGLVMVFVLVGK